MTNENLKKNIEIILNTAHLLGSELTKKNIFEQFETAITKAKEAGREEAIVDIIEGKILLPQLNQDK